jgi:energy-coupling factor transporter ATP-binding protein EcfA2
MKILKLTAENVKRIKVVEITPEGDMVVVGGPNDAGKSTILDAIAMAIGGAAQAPTAPLRRGTEAARIVVDLGDLVVTRTYKAGGKTTLVVANKEGARYPSPQAVLDKFYGALAFDPLLFERLTPGEQAEMLRRLVGLDTSDLDLKRQGLYNERAERNKDVRALQVQLEALPDHQDATEVSIAGIANRLAEAEKARQYASRMDLEYARLRRAVDVAEANRRHAVDEIAQAEATLVELRASLAELEAKEGECRAQATVGQMQAAEASQAVPDTAALRASLAAAEDTNKQVAANRRRAEASGLLADAKGLSALLTDRIEGVDKERMARIAAATYPVPGLTVGDEGVLLDGLPFEQASTSDRIRVSVAIGLAQNKDLRILLVRDGSLLGSEKLRLLAEMATAAGAQVWLEMLQEAPDARTTVFIEDGTVVAPKAARQPRLATSQAQGL